METKSKNQGSKPKITVFDYTDYRRLLKDYIALRQQQEAQFSLRMFSRLVGFDSHNYMSLILQGKRNLQSDQIPALIRIMKLNHAEAEFFETLVTFNQSRHEEQRGRCVSKLIKYWKRNRVTPLNPTQYEIVSNWYCLVIREMVLLDDFKNDPEWIAKRLGKTVTPSEVREAIHLLTQAGLLKEVDGKLTQVESNVLAEGEVTSLALRSYHRGFIPRGLEAIDSVPMGDREINGTTIAVSVDTFQRLKKKIKEFQRELLQMLPTNEKHRRIYQLNMQFFPVLKD